MPIPIPLEEAQAFRKQGRFQEAIDQVKGYMDTLLGDQRNERIFSLNKFLNKIHI